MNFSHDVDIQFERFCLRAFQPLMISADGTMRNMRYSQLSSISCTVLPFCTNVFFEGIQSINHMMETQLCSHQKDGILANSLDCYSALFLWIYFLLIPTHCVRILVLVTYFEKVLTKIFVRVLVDTEIYREWQVISSHVRVIQIKKQTYKLHFRLQEWTLVNSSLVMPETAEQLRFLQASHCPKPLWAVQSHCCLQRKEKPQNISKSVSSQTRPTSFCQVSAHL